MTKAYQNELIYTVVARDSAKTRAEFALASASGTTCQMLFRIKKGDSE